MPNGRTHLTQAMHEGAARKTLHFEAATLRQLFRVAARRGMVPSNPFDEVRVSKPKRHEIAARHHPLTEAEEAALLQAAAQMDRDRPCNANASFSDAFLFLLKTGLRENELRILE